MTKVALFREDADAEGMTFRAMTARTQAMGRTA
jgi:hypothetical protein